MAINAEQAAKEYADVVTKVKRAKSTAELIAEEAQAAQTKRAVPRYSEPAPWHIITDVPSDVSLKAEREYDKNNLDQILKDRGSKYGLFKYHAQLTYSLKCVFSEFVEEIHPDKIFSSSQCEAIDMIFHKLGRVGNGDPNYADSWRDIAGYATLVADELEGVER